ncbi:acyltransferase domain-containing protein [Mycobacterium heidelbergense]|uniref:Polyketide synthase n=1 Tax=Mycobacterium heidelbergense TaxID=53376 RepID=A0A1X0DKF5_MYCHE|nr:type I polyketide synthase [Mycobacterium heidelbergense]MCV7052224.1 acyltransferase domain-containing protein [Mycobacterium heidelbergense]ORA72893.1 polyketide synthase [Mycobacterium heidelbergense]BBZ48737.1 phthiocerol synthesis polyketide synthase type I PpsE [Mycobacterium heidelbergense]
MSTNAGSYPEALPDNAIAVVGMAGRFPGANNVSDFWDNLRRGEESIVTLSEEDLRAAGISDEVLANPGYVRRAPVVDGFDEFDAEFFGFPPQLARKLDPQHRLFLQCAWHALEDAGCDPARFDGSIGVFGTSSPSGYLMHNLASHHGHGAFMATGLDFEQFNLFLQNDKDFLATRVSHQFDLRGPSISVQTACSSSLVAIHLACQSLLSGECDMALAGGSSLAIPHRVGYWNSPGAMVSAAGHCRPFDVRADGTVFGSGAAIVALKPLQAAIDAGDRIHAVIRGSAINNDGSMKMGYAAPNPAAQADVIAEAHAVAGIDASTVSYVETHGTGTALGDPIEVQGLKSAFAVSQMTRVAPCVLGSVKSNIGHLEVAAGVVSLIKAVLCLKHKAIPATLHFTSPNPELHLDETPFTVQSEYGPWEWDGALRAGVSSFGVGGTNVHVVLEEAPVEAPPVPTAAKPDGPHVLLLSARTAAALEESRATLAATLAGPDGPDLADAAFTLSGRRKHGIAMAAVVHDREHAAKVLRAAEHDNVFVGESVSHGDADESAPTRVVFMFPGQGAQHVGMARGLYDTEPVFAEHFDTCVAGFRDAMGIDLKAEIFGDSTTDLERIDRSQPALFTVEYALAKLVDTYGVRAGAYVGYSTGEYVAATLAGIFDLETAIKTVALRARLMHESPPGAMVAVALGADEIAQYLSPGVELSAVNDPGNCVVAGPRDQIRAFSQRLGEHGIVARRVRATHAFHTSSMNPMLAEFQEFLSRQELRAPHTPLLSNLTGTWMSDAQATDPASWAQQISATVRFADELGVVLADPDRVLVEMGPGGSLTGSALRHPKWSGRHRAVRLMRHPVQNIDDRDAFLLGLGQLWAADVAVDFSPLTGSATSIVSLPGYPFARERHWIDPKPTVWAEAPADADGPATDGDAVSAAPVNGQSATEATLHRIWTQCLGVATLDRNANFFEMGGDSLIAIGISTSANNAGLGVTPQHLYEHPTVAGLAAALDAEFTGVGLTEPPGAEAHLPVPANIAGFFEHGVSETGRWRVPLIFRLAPGVTVEDVRSVLTALANHHDALRLQFVDRAGTWEQRITAPQEFQRLSSRTLPDDVAAEPAARRAAVLDVVAELVAQDDLTASFTAAYVAGGQHGSYLILSAHEIIADNASREILLLDLFTAFTQQLAGEEILLPPTGATWRDWSLRSGTLATHPAVLDTCDFWLRNSSAATLRLSDREITGQPRFSDLVRLPSALTVDETAGLDDVRRRLNVSMEEVLLAALSRTIAETVGDGVVSVDLEGAGRSVLRPDVDLRRTVGRFTTVYPAALQCAPDGALTDLLSAARDTVKSVPHYGVGYGLLRYVYAPTARLLAALGAPDIHLRYIGMIPQPPAVDAPVQLDSDAATPVREAIPGLGHAIELRVCRHSGVLHFDWWYDARRVPGARAEALAQRFPVALRALVRDANDAIPDGGDVGSQPVELALVDLSDA